MHYTTMKRMLSLVLALALCLSLSALGVSAAQGPAVSSNIDEHYYINAQRWTDPIKSTLTPEGDGYVRTEYIDGVLVVENYDKNLQYISGRTLALELPIYGGVYLCDDYNFVVVGQNNYEEDDTVEVFRIIRYSKDWVRQGSCGLFGANTIEPFQAGAVRFDRCGDYLYIRTAHKMYASASDGLNHQANVMINVRVSDMAIADSFTDVLNKSYGYISHSFNQFVRVDGTDLLAVDHGDALPRSVVLIKYHKPAGQDSFYGRVSLVNALPIMDSTYHYNDTGVSVGGFECSSSHYLIAGNAYDGTEPIDLMYAHRNIFVTATPKDNFTDDATAVHWLTGYTAADQVDVSPPHMVKISAERFCLIWTEDGVLKYCFINGKGEPEGEIVTGEGALSDCVPVVDGNRIIWYVTDNSAPVFYEIPIASGHSHSYTATVVAPTCTEGGWTVYTCECGDSYTADETAALGHSAESVPGTPATCTQAGLTEGSICCVCGEVLTAQEAIPALGHSFDGGICKGCNSGVVLNAATDETYSTIGAALADAAEGQTLKLLGNWTEAQIMVTPGITLDLGGYELTADNVVCFDDAHLVDSAGTGRLVAGRRHVVLDEENAMVPVYGGEGYLFTKAGFAIHQDAKHTGEGIKINAAAYPVNMDVVELLKDGSEDNDIQIMIRLSWDTADGTGSQEFVFTDEVVGDVYSSNNGSWSGYSKMFSMVITGFANIENLRANMMIVSGTDVQYVSATSVSIT